MTMCLDRDVLTALDFEAQCECEWPYLRMYGTSNPFALRCPSGKPENLVSLVTLEGTVGRRAVCGECVDRLRDAGRLVDVWRTGTTTE